MIRTLRYPAAALLIALVASGIAVAANPGKTTKKVAASFSATVQHANTRMCTGADGTYAVTDAVYIGTATGTLTEGATDALKIHAHSVVNQTTGDGITTGRFSIKNGTGRVADGLLFAVVSGAGSLDGTMLGRGPGTPPPPPPSQKLIANFTGTLSSGGMTGEIGGNGSMTNTAVAQGGPCPAPASPHSQPHPSHPHLHIHPQPPANPPRHH
jgi:hypothetical protein